MPTENYPSNSRIGKIAPAESEKEEPKFEKVTESTVIRRKKPWHRRMIETFVGGDDATSVGGYIIQDVIVPATKDLVVDAATTFVERLFFGDDYTGRGGRRRSRGGRGTHTDYNGISTRTASRRDDPRREISARGREQHDFDEIVIPSRVDADAVLEEMFECLSKFDVVTVANLYEMVGTTPTHVDRKWGWEGPGALSGSRPVRVNGGYLLDLPRPEYIQ